MKSKWQDYKNSAEKAQAEGKYSFAESLWYAALEESMDFPANDRRRALSMERLCECLWFQQKFADCEPLALKLVAIYTEVFGPDHVDVAAMHANLGLLYVAMKRDEDAEQEEEEGEAQAEGGIACPGLGLGLGLGLGVGLGMGFRVRVRVGVRVRVRVRVRISVRVRVRPGLGLGLGLGLAARGRPASTRSG